jgi:transcriptional regulator with XRE-family HTH domain
MNLGETIKSLRQEIGWNPTELARKCKVSPTTIYDIEDGSRNPSERLLRIIAAHLNADAKPLIELIRKKKELIKRVRSNPEEFEAMLEEK